MKRRNFLTGVCAAIGAVLAPVAWAKAKIHKTPDDVMAFGMHRGVDFNEGTIESWSGLWVSSARLMHSDDAWEFTCPCGVTAYYPMNGLPEESTPHPCGDPRHWTVEVG